uniref:Uncharacterized protein n=1 Tax=Oncorhynchus mykiss TaxID=8022 RepID=A0A8K9WQ76_ONCMY
QTCLGAGHSPYNGTSHQRVIRGDGERDLGGVQRLQQPPLLLQEVCLGHQLLDVPLQLRLPEVDMLQSLSQVPRPLSLGAQSPGLGLRIQCFGLMANPLCVVSVCNHLVKGREIEMLEVPFLQASIRPGFHSSGLPFLRAAIPPGFHSSGLPFLRASIPPGFHSSGLPFLRAAIPPGFHSSGILNNHTRPGPPHLGSSPAGSSETSHPDS